MLYAKRGDCLCDLCSLGLMILSGLRPGGAAGCDFDQKLGALRRSPSQGFANYCDSLDRLGLGSTSVCWHHLFLVLSVTVFRRR
jgi:hypothetical protein